MSSNPLPDIPFPLMGWIWPQQGFKDGATNYCMGHYAMAWLVAENGSDGEKRKFYFLYLNSNGQLLGLAAQTEEVTDDIIQKMFLLAEGQLRIGYQFLPEEVCDPIYPIPFPELSAMCGPKSRGILHKMIALGPESRIPWLNQEMHRLRSQIQQTSPAQEDYGHDDDPFDGLSPGDVRGPKWNPGNPGNDGRGR